MERIREGIFQCSYTKWKKYQSHLCS